MAEPTPSRRRLVQVAIAAGAALVLLFSLLVGLVVLARHDVRAFWLRTTSTSGEQPMLFSIDDVSLSRENGLTVAIIGRLAIPHASVSVKQQFVLFSWSLYPFRVVGLVENHL